MANEVKWVEGTLTTVISLAAALNNAANTYTGMTGITMANLDNSTLLYPDLRLVLGVPDTFAAAPTAGGTIDVWYSKEDVDSTTDETPLPASSDIKFLAQYLCSFVMDDQDVAVVKSKIVRGAMYGVKQARFYLLNQCGQQMSYSTNPITLKAAVLTRAPT